MQDGLDLKDVVLLGRTFAEYARYFQFDAAALKGKHVLDVASGVSSFGAEARAAGLDVTGADPSTARPRRCSRRNAARTWTKSRASCRR